MGARAGEMLRSGLLEGAGIVLAGAAGGAAGAAVREAVEALGGRCAEIRLDPAQEPEAAETAAAADVAEALAALGPVEALVVDGGSLFAAGGGAEALLGCLAASWNAARALAGAAFIPSGRGRMLLIAPAAGEEHAGPAAAAFENLARTLSIEWARFGITTVSIAPGADTSLEELAALCCYLLSPAGAYFSGCLLDLRGAAPPAPST